MSRVVVAGRRTWIGSEGRALAGHDAAQLASAVLAAVQDDVRRLGAPGAVQDVVLGSAAGPGGNVARVAALLAGLPDTTPAMTVDRQCASGLAAVLAGEHPSGDRIVLAGGTESASYRSSRARARFAPAGADPDMGPAADALAAAAGVTRERQDRYAVRSHDRAGAAHEGGRFDAETVMVPVPGPVAPLGRDQHVRALDPHVVARLRPAFTAAGTVTAASAAPVSDGAAAVAVVTESQRARLGAPGLRIVDGCTSACDPRLPGWGPVPAVQTLLGRSGLTTDDLGAIEVVEAFAAQVLAVMDALGIDEDDERLNPDGGAIALGHPWGASGAVALVRLFSRLVHGGAPRGTLGLATVAAGGGLGVAVLVEVVR
ncbi:acetyl-CoA acetyltransferase [Paraoerskovia sediminicola]|uniref:Probable acetyl-CoA acetyltransferase n=1 Tax=Paraoerskovia sediminicola TaxID=1138587 RepID=A0ABM8FYF5_9CELL|nr:thiolase family protein [Paraoerskovia sediminicola]BDZ40773.1 acetyl-CoA acetyltransferase [Paraoerskovia sediminicola]